LISIFSGKIQGYNFHIITIGSIIIIIINLIRLAGERDGRPATCTGHHYIWKVSFVNPEENLLPNFRVVQRVDKGIDTGGRFGEEGRQHRTRRLYLQNI